MHSPWTWTLDSPTRGPYGKPPPEAADQLQISGNKVLMSSVANNCPTYYSD